METSSLPIPDELRRLWAASLWPKSPYEAVQQNLRNRIDPAVVAGLLSIERQIFLYPPPFFTLAADHARSTASFRESEFSRSYEESFRQIEPEKALFVADSGLGSDAPIALDYRASYEDPPVLGLSWSLPAPGLMQGS